MRQLGNRGRCMHTRELFPERNLVEYDLIKLDYDSLICEVFQAFKSNTKFDVKTFMWSVSLKAESPLKRISHILKKIV